MTEQQFLHSQQLLAAQLPPLNPNQTRIEINWGKAVAKTIEIRRHHNEMATKLCGTTFKAGYQQGHDAQLALAAEAQQILASRPGRRVT